MMSQPPPNQHAMPPNAMPPNAMPMQPPQQQQQQQPPPYFQQPNFSQPPFGMPPPGFGAPGGFPPGGPSGPWGMPPAGWNTMMANQHDKPAKNLLLKPGVIDPAILARASEWSEHRAPDGRPYYHHPTRGESVWEKPQALRDLEAARMAAHGAMPPQQPPNMPPPHMMNPLMHMPPAAAAAFDPVLAFNAAAAAAAALKNAENNKAAQAALLEKEAKRAAEELKAKQLQEQKKASAAAAAIAKPVDKSRPISSTPIAGTPWCVVWTGDGRVFFYNPSTRSSVWERPEDLVDREDVNKAVNNPPEQLRGNSSATTEHKPEEVKKPVIDYELEKAKEILAAHANTTAAFAAQQLAEKQSVEDDDDEVIKIRTESESSSDELPTKKSRLGKCLD